MTKVHFHYLEKSIRIKNSKGVKEIVMQIFADYYVTIATIDYIFCSDKYLLKLNKEFLFHDYYTDVVTFSLHKPGEPLKGEVYISSERVKDNAKKYKAFLQQEMRRVIFHSALHLCGLNDQTDTERGTMKERENHYLSILANVSQATVS